MLSERDSRIESLLALAALAILAVGCFVVLRPFLSAALWAVILCYATWPIYLWFYRQFRGRRTLTAVAMTALVALVVVLPFAVVGPRIAEEGTIVARSITRILQEGPPGPPEWVSTLPLIGPDLAVYWDSLAHDSTKFTEALQRYVVPQRDVLISIGAALGQGVLELCLSLFIAFFLYRDGDRMSEHVTTAVRRFVGERSKSLMEVAGDTTRGVVYGILGTALAQGALAGIGFYLVGLSAAVFLGLLTFVLSLIPMGPPLVWLPTAIWLLSDGRIGAGIFIFFWGMLVVSGIDNFLKPYFISREGKLPFLLVFLGVLGGLAAFGFIGIFLGPVVLSIGFSLTKEWSTPPRSEEH
jgi:predicted PurR-regulated permease PerM